MGVLVTHHFLFTTVVVSPLELDDYSGAALRGSLFNGVWERFCNNKTAPTCADCPLHSICPVSALVAPLREENPRGQDIPRPYIILPPLGDARRYAPGAELIFGITLFGNIVQLFPYIIMATQAFEARGLGKKLEQNRGQRGRFKVKQIESYHPLSGERNTVYREGKPLVSVPTLAVSSKDVATRAATLPSKKITINFLTPTRITFQEKLVHHATFYPLIMRLLDRLEALEESYGVEGNQSLTASSRDLAALAKEVQCSEDLTHWEELHSFSNRQHRLTPISGIEGKATFEGDLTPFQDLLVWGELIHVGKNAVKGNGWYKIETPSN